MTTLTYCKGLPTPATEMNSLGFTDLEMFLSSFAPVFHEAACETVDHLSSESRFDKSGWNTHLQQRYGILKRHANGVISFAKGLIDSAKECRANHIKTLTGKLKSLEKWIKKAEKKSKNATKFYAKKNWQNSKTGKVSNNFIQPTEIMFWLFCQSSPGFSSLFDTLIYLFLLVGLGV